MTTNAIMKFAASTALRPRRRNSGTTCASPGWNPSASLASGAPGSAGVGRSDAHGPQSAGDAAAGAVRASTRDSSADATFTTVPPHSLQELRPVRAGDPQRMHARGCSSTMERNCTFCRIEALPLLALEGDAGGLPVPGRRRHALVPELVLQHAPHWVTR